MGYKDADADESIAGRNEVRSGTPFYSPQAGENGKWKRNRLRVLPPRDDQTDGKYYKWVAIHGDIFDRPILCNEKMFDEDCPACTHARELQRAGRTDDAKRFWPNWRALMNVIALTSDGEPIKETDGSVRIRVWAAARSLWDELLDKGVPTLPEGERDISHVKEGRDLIVKRKGTGQKDTKYEWLKDPNDDDVIAFPAASPLPKAVLATIRDDDDALHILDGVYSHLPSAKVAGLLKAPERSDPFEDDEDEKPVDGTYRELPAADEDEDDPPAKSAKSSKASKPATADRVTSAREELQRRINAAQPADDDEDEE